MLQFKVGSSPWEPDSSQVFYPTLRERFHRSFHFLSSFCLAGHKTRPESRTGVARPVPIPQDKGDGRPTNKVNWDETGDDQSKTQQNLTGIPACCTQKLPNERTFSGSKCCVTVETITPMFSGKTWNEHVQKGLNHVHHVSNLCHF